jgi:branched-chain amino acid transport system substrate-binding protein
VVALALSACGTRVDEAEVEAGVGGGAVTLAPESVAALTQLRDGRIGGSPTASVAGRPDDVVSGTPDASREDAPSTTGRRSQTAVTALAQASGAGGCPRQLAPVAIGQVGMFSGVLGPITGSMRITLAAWAQDVNSRGGLRCRPVEVYSSDDGGDPARSAYLVQDMVARHHVVAFVASMIATPNAFHQAVAAAKVPVVGGPGGEAWRDSPWVFPESASGADQIFGMIRNGVEQGNRKLGLLYCVEAPACTEAVEMARNSAEPAGAELVYSSPASITQTDYTAACLNARKAGVDQFALGLDGASIGRVARSCEAIGYRPLLSTLASLFSPAHAADPLVRSFGVATTTGTAAWFLDDTPGLRDFHRVLARWAPQTPPDGAAVIAFTAAKLFEAAIAAVATDVASEPITSALVLRGLFGIRDESLGGLTVGLTFRSGQKKAPSSGCVFYELLNTTGWTAPQGSRPVCRNR